MKYKLTVPGRPVPAVRMTQRSKYKSEQAMRYLDYKNTVGWVALAAGVKVIKGPVKLTTIFYFANKKLPDLDNLIKAISDGLNGLAWEDDRQVVRIEAERRQDKEERAEIEISEAV